MLSIGSQWENIGPVSIYGEIWVMNLLNSLAKNMIKDYPTTFHQDNEILKNDEVSKTDNLSFNQRNIITFRWDEKLTLGWLIEYSKSIVNVLSQPTFEKIIKEKN